jgi:hypothetical protein
MPRTLLMSQLKALKKHRTNTQKNNSKWGAAKIYNTKIKLLKLSHNTSLDFLVMSNYFIVLS